MDKVDELVDEMLLGDYKKIKLSEQASDMVDIILDNYDENVEEVVNQIDHVPDESAEGEHDKIKDELSKDERQLDEVENALDSEPKQDGDEQLAALQDEMSKEEETRTTESVVDLVKKAFKEVREEKAV